MDEIGRVVRIHDRHQELDSSSEDMSSVSHPIGIAALERQKLIYLYVVQES